MQFSSWQEFLAMGGYALFVWSSFALTLITLAIILVTPVLRGRQLRRQLQRLERLREQENAQ
jgi:heme exporter protein D